MTLATISHPLPPVGLVGKAALVPAWTSLPAADLYAQFGNHRGNRGIRLDNLVVADCDNAEEVAWWLANAPVGSPYQSRGDRTHRSFWYRRPPGTWGKFNLRPKLEIRTGPGMQCAIPPSIHHDGVAYEWLGPALTEESFMSLPLFPEALLAEGGRRKEVTGMASKYPLSAQDVQGLLGPLGWHEDGAYWVHPKSSNGMTAVLYDDGRLHIFGETCAPLTQGKQYDRLDLQRALGKSMVPAVRKPGAPDEVDSGEALVTARLILSTIKVEEPRFNLITQRAVWRGEQLTEGARAQIRQAARGERCTPAAAEDAFQIVAESNPFHPVQDFLTEARSKWLANQQPSLSAVVDYFHPADEFGRWFPRWMFGAVRRAFTGAQNPVLVLTGGQGLGKSKFVRWLCSPLPEYYHEGGITPDSTDCSRMRAEKLVWEVPELGATTRKADREALKDFISAEQIELRLPYAHDPVRRRALSSFIATVNPEGSGGFLNDPTGYRRFLVAALMSIDWGYTALDPVLIWGEATDIWRTHPDEANLTRAEERLRDQAIKERYETSDPISDLVAEHIRYTGDPADWVSNNEIYAHLAEQISGGVRGQGRPHAVGVALNALGAKSLVRKVDGQTKRGWQGIQVVRRRH